jgi:hypothetical protein
MEDIAMSFRIKGLSTDPFQDLFALSDAELKARNVLRRTAAHPAPCRVSLTDAALGDEILLVNYTHHPVDNPYHSHYAIWVRRGEQTFDAVDQVPDQLRRRILALRTWDADDLMVGFEVVDGREIEGAIVRLFADPRAAYMHAHFAGPGCYAARIERA